MKNKVRKILMILSCLISLSFTLSAQNPYLPLWEFIPDGEPYVFEDPDCPGKYRVYIYGSHDNLKWMYCGRDQVVWSAPIEDLTRWRYDGVIFKGKFYQFNLSSCIRQQNSLTAQFVSFSLSNLANIFYPPPIFTIINLCLL